MDKINKSDVIVFKKISVKGHERSHFSEKGSITSEKVL